jgi:hypothetical protein
MNKLMLTILLTLMAGATFATQDENEYRVTGNLILISKQGKSHRCKLDEIPRYAVKSYDRTALIVSERGYVPIKLLETCNANVPVHVSHIPHKVGVLADINIKRDLYVSLDFVNVQPFLYLATVAHLNSSKNLVTLSGAYVPGSKLSVLKRHAFGGSGEAGSSLISPDGRFVAASGRMICTDEAYPGVWDIENNRRVITDDESCNALFLLKGNE